MVKPMLPCPKVYFPLNSLKYIKWLFWCFRLKTSKIFEFCDIFKNILSRRHASNRLEILVIGIDLARSCILFDNLHTFWNMQVFASYDVITVHSNVVIILIVCYTKLYFLAKKDFSFLYFLNPAWYTVPTINTWKTKSVFGPEISKPQCLIEKKSEPLCALIGLRVSFFGFQMFSLIYIFL